MGEKKYKEKYDLICSLGGNCAAAHNLYVRNLRRAAYPFDWTYCKTDEAVYKLAEGFKDGFKNYMLLENFNELPINPSHSDRIQYEDTYGKLVWANHFSYTKDRDKNYREVKEKFDRRFKRLISSVEKSKRILFIFSTNFEINIDCFKNLYKTLCELYPEKEIYIKVVSFCRKQEETISEGNIDIYCHTRNLNEYDFVKTNYEWSFLDNVQLTKKMRCKIAFNLLKYKIKIEWSR